MDRGAWQAIVHSSQSDTTEVTEHTQPFSGEGGRQGKKTQVRGE